MADRDAELRDILSKANCIAVVGIKAEEAADAFRVPRYLQAAGYRILPVNPKLDEVLGERCSPSLADVGVPFDLVNLFRAPDHIPGHVEEILALTQRPAAVWMQLGIQHGESAARLRAAGIHVVQDRCIMVDHRRLLAGGA